MVLPRPEAGLDHKYHAAQPAILVGHRAARRPPSHGGRREALQGATLVISALPAQATPHFIEKYRGDIPADAIFCCTSKGLYLEEGCFLSAMLRAFQRPQTLAFLSGPSFARQICERHPTALVCASAKLADAVQVQFALKLKTLPRLRVAGHRRRGIGRCVEESISDRRGHDRGGRFRHKYPGGVRHARATRELTVLCVAMGGRPETISGLAGVGDLMLTAFGDLSRNRNCGLRLAKGESLDTILQSCTVEGVPTASVAKAFATKCNLDLPLFTAVAMILDGA